MHRIPRSPIDLPPETPLTTRMAVRGQAVSQNIPDHRPGNPAVERPGRPDRPGLIIRHIREDQVRAKMVP